MALIIFNGVINNLDVFRTLGEPCKFFYTCVFHLEVESTFLLVKVFLFREVFLGEKFLNEKIQ